MKLYNSFVGGTMNKDIEIRLMPKTIFLDAKNIRIFTPDSNNSRSVKIPLGNTVKSALSLGTNPICIGSCIDPFRNLIYWAVKSDTGSYVCEYDVAAETEEIILQDTSVGTLNFQVGGYVEMRILNDNDNGRNFLVLTDGVNEPKYVETEFAKTLTVNAFTIDDIGLIKKPPPSAPTLSLGATTSGTENNIETKFLSFAYRYKYAYGEYSAMSSFSEFAFMPSTFSYDYNSGTNKSMYNNFSKVTITFDRGGTNVTDIEIIVKESGSNTAFIVENINKADNAASTIEFSNSKIFRALSSDQLSRVYDNVPTKAGTLEIIGNRLVFGNYTEGYDLEYSGSAIVPTFTLGYSTTAGTEGVAHQQVKSNRDYEVAISYTDGIGRFTTPITSEGNTVYVQNADAINKNVLQVTMDADVRPPDWATGYRFYIKQSKVDYDVIASIKFYRDGVYAYVKIDGDDINKVAEGDFIYVKSDTTGLQTNVIRTKVLEVKVQDRNFLETDAAVIVGTTTLQSAGTYMKLNVDGFTMSESAVSIYDQSIYYAFRSSSTDNNIGASINYIEPPRPINVTGLDDVAVVSIPTSYNSDWDIRFEIEIDANGTPDTFKWRTFNVTTNTTGSWNTGYSVATSPTLLQNTVEIQWGQTTGHTIGDSWVVSAKSSDAAILRNNDTGTAGGLGYKALVWYEGKDVGDEGISVGASIVLEYSDTGSASGVNNKAGAVQIELTSTADYVNIEEWFYGDNIVSQLSALVSDITEVIFRRGTLTKTDGQELDVDPAGRIYMGLSSPAYWSNSGSSEIRIDTGMTITEFDNNIIFETIPVDLNTDVFYELPLTYPITSNNHYGNGGSDVNQNFGVTAAVINLDYFNSFGWYNGFESMKIGDTFNQNAMILDTKPSTPLSEYKAITRIASLTYSGIYESTTQFNALNEFNLSTANYKDLDTKYGIIKKLWSKDTDLLVFQQDKTHSILFNKSVLYNADGSGNVTQSLNVLGQEIAKLGEYGIGDHPESFAINGNRIYHMASGAGALMRLGNDGYTEISERGMYDYFRTLASQTNHVGGYDPYNGEYLINVVPDASPLTVAFVEGEEGGFSSFYEFEPERMVNIDNRLYSIKDGQIWLHDDNTTRNNFYGDQRVAEITTVFNDSPIDVKHWKSINLETDTLWDAYLTTDFGSGTIVEAEWSLEESEYYAYTRQNETTSLATATESMSAYQGLGTIASINTLTLTMGFELPRNLAVGDEIYERVDADNVTLIGVVTALNVTAGTITLDTVTGLIATDHILYKKNERVEGAAIKGHYLQLRLTSDTVLDKELFAVKAEAVRSFD